MIIVPRNQISWERNSNFTNRYTPMFSLLGQNHIMLHQVKTNFAIFLTHVIIPKNRRSLLEQVVPRGYYISNLYHDIK